MSYNLWRCLFEDDVDAFRQYLANATVSSAAPRTTSTGQAGGFGLKSGSPGNLAASPKTPLRFRKSSGHTPANATLGKAAGAVLTRADLNTKDSFGRTILHHAASSRSEDALQFVKVLLDMPFLDLSIQDLESGWTPLHRALYFGNISAAHALMARDLQDATDYTTTAQHSHAGGLVKIKDHEGNSPFEVFGLTIAPRSLQHDSSTLAPVRDDDSTNGVDDNGDQQNEERSRRHVHPSVDLLGDEVYAFGSNKNLSLGTGDGDDRHYPERLHFERPDHLLRRLLHDHLAERQKGWVHEDLTHSTGALHSHKALPAVIRYRPVTIQNVVMSKLHTAVLTNDPVSTLYICGYGPGGRLGTGDENTSFTYRCIQAGGLAKRRISAIALGQDHSIAVCSQGEVFTWGSNRYGQLGYALPEAPKDEVPTQLVPRQLFGYIKKEVILGAAASALHSAIYTSSALYTFGKNEGQLGLMDADARSLELQVLPRRVGVSVLQSPIQSVSAIDRATIVLLENHDVIVFTHYGWTKVLFPLETFSNYYMSDNLSTRYNMETNYIKQITGGGNTICTMSSFGEVYTIEVPRVSETVPSNASTTNPTKARNALPAPSRLWSLGKAHMAATDVAVGQDSSIIICTASGSAWRKEKRANIKSVRDTKKGSGRPKDYKFVRIPNLTGVVAVRSNAFGAFMAVRKDATVTREQILPDAPSLWNDLFHLLPFQGYGSSETTPPSGNDPAQIARAVISNASAESDFLAIGHRHEPLSRSQYDLWIASTVTDVRIPIHSFVLKGRSSVMRGALTEFQETYYFAIPDVLSIEYGQDGQIQVTFKGADFLTLATFVFYLYTDNLIDVWHYTSQALHLAPRYRSVRLELMKLASHLEMRGLERAVRVMVDPVRGLANDMELAVLDPDFFSDADVLLELADDAEMPAHSVLLCSRCPFFDGLFNGRTGGMWMASRRNEAEAESEAVRVDLKHIDEKTFVMVLRHLYADTGEELFDDIVTSTLDEFLDIVIEVMSVANELMLDRLAQICQQTLGRYVSVRNICSLVNTVAESTVQSFKKAALEYICLNLESMMELRLLDELDPDLLLELDTVVQDNQLAFLPFARSERAEADLLENHPDLISQIETARQRRVDSMRLRSRLVEDEERYAASVKVRYGSLDRHASSPHNKSALRTPADASPLTTPSHSPAILANDTADDLPFDMDADIPEPLPAPAREDLNSPSAKVASSPENTRPPPRIRQSELGLSPIGALRVGGAGLSGLESHRAADPISAVTPTSGFNSRGAPWQIPLHGSKKDGLKDIMEQASAGRVSQLTQAMRSSSTTPKTNAKVSQKERKRQQQQIKEQTVKVSETVRAGPTADAPSSPWQTIAKSPKTESSPIVDARKETGKQTQAKQPITMRQPMAEASSTGPVAKEPSGGGQSPSLSPPSSKPAAPQIQSIRHTPVRTRGPPVDARTSMAEILAQQQIEKTAVKEAVAKRSLQEIQQEQEFQEWWDNESKRVQEEEAQATAAAGRRGKGGRGRGGQRRGGGRGKATLAVEANGHQRKSWSTEGPLIAQGFASGGETEPGLAGMSRGSASRGRGRGQGNTQHSHRGGQASTITE
ncbi:ankyrin repeat containing protein [Cladophialophora carrionii]|uniref:Ankyrin repeat containing protein n=1 Tax=Cladophialophora carrionii TaxID=86049 RepID=A0A1C1CD21_9EURO|nr:ankyrin repeat containing protein [Cladophialophora carrionii]